MAREIRQPWARVTGIETVDVFIRDLTRYLRELTTTVIKRFSRSDDGLVPAPGEAVVVPDDYILHADGTWGPQSTSSLADGNYGDVSVAGGGTSITLNPGVVDLTDLSDMNTDRLIGRDTAAVGPPEELAVSGGLEFTGTGGIQRSALTGDVTAAAGNNATTIANDAVSNAKAANMADSTIKGRAVGGGTGDPQDLTAAQVIAILTGGGLTGGGYGSGIDGPATIGAGTTTLTADKEYTTLVVQSGGILDCAGYTVRASVSIEVQAGGTIRNNGAASTGSGGGNGGAGAATSLLGGGGGGNGGVGNGANGTGRAEQPKQLPLTGATSGVGGAGGAGSGSTGGNGGVYTQTSLNGSPFWVPWILQGNFPYNNGTKIAGGTGGGGGGGSAGAGGASGGGGGGGIVTLASPTITNSGAIEAKGGGSANATGANAGSGGGGGGGKVFIVCRTFTGTAPDVSGGLAGAKTGTGVKGSDGSTGYSLTVTGV